MMKWNSSVLVHLMMVFFCGCGSNLKVNYNDTGLKDDVVHILSQKKVVFKNDMEKEIVTAQLFGFFSCMKQLKGEDAWARFVEDIDNTQSITESVFNIYEQTTFQMAGDIHLELDDQLTSKPVGQLKMKTVGQFNIYYHTGSLAERDLDQIVYLLNQYNVSLSTFFLTTDEKKRRFVENVSYLNGGKIQLFLLSDKQSIEDYFGDVNGAAATLLFHELNSQDKYQLTANVMLKYHELFTTYTLTHELAHIYWAFSEINPTYMAPYTASEINALQTEIENSFAGISTPGALTEGIAEYVTGEANLLYQYGLFDPIQVQMNSYVERNGITLTIAELDKRIYDFNYIGYEVAYSLFSFVVATFGIDAALALSYTDGDDDAYRDILNTDKESLSKDWHTAVTNSLLIDKSHRVKML